jgi:hypothetical protein
MRLLTFLLVFLAVAVLVVGSIFWINRDSFLTVFQNRPAILEGSEWVEKTYSLGGLIEFMAEQPQHASLLSIAYPEGEAATEDDGSVPDNAGTRSIRYRSDIMHPAGTLSNLMLVITYADLATSGSLDPRAPVDPEKIASFHIPGLDRRHQQTFRRWLSELPAPPAVDDLVRYLLRHNDPAAADYLFFFLEPDEVTGRTLHLGDGLIEPPVPQFGIRMAALGHPAGQTLSEHLSALSGTERSVFLEDAVAIARQQWERPADIAPSTISSFQDQRVLHGLYPRLQPDRFAGLVAAIWQGTLINETASDMLQQLLLREPDDRLLRPHVSWYAAQFDERMSYLSGWSAAGKTKSTGFRVHMVLVVDIPAGLWFHMNSNFMVQDFHNRMFYDPAIRTRSHDLLN